MKCSFLRRGKTAAAIAISASAIALAASLPATATAATVPHHHARSSWTGAIVLVNCQRRGLVLPSSFILACADGNDFLTGMRWVSWRTVAYGSGVEVAKSCVPNCSASHFRRFPVLITLWRAKRRGRTDQWKFTRLTVIYTGRRPLKFNRHGKKEHPLTFTWHV
jgi:hypothetical protein